jgi:uncharacterized protein (TIGR03435 family)
MTILRATTWFSLFGLASFSGQAALGQRFEVASIRPSNADIGSSGIKTGHGRLEAQNVTVKRCIIGAYGVGPHQISGGPAWFATERFDISAKADQPVGDALLMILLQKLLEERFHLAIHHETKQMPALVVEIGRNGPKMEKATAGEAGTNTSGNNAGVTIDAHNTSMDLFAKVLSREMDFPVVNKTGLEGVFNFKLSWARENAAPEPDGAPEGSSIFTAVQEQLGLNLSSQKAPVDLLVIDHLELPSPN